MSNLYFSLIFFLAQVSLFSVMSSHTINSAFLVPREVLGLHHVPSLGGPLPQDNSYYPYMRNATVVDTVPKEILHMIHDHWYQFPPLNPLWHSLLGLAMILLGIISVIGNGMVIYIMGFTKVIP